VTLQPTGSAMQVAGLVPWESPLYQAGVAQDDQLVALGGVDLRSPNAWNDVLSKRKPGERVALRFVRRSGQVVNTTIALEEDPSVEVVLIEKSGGSLTDDQRRFRDSWLGSLQKR